MFKERKRRIWPYILLFFALLIVSAGVVAYQFITHLTPEKVVQLPIVKEIIHKQAGKEGDALLRFLPEALGYQSPKTYLFLFENNTELRPGGGFIGAYAVIRLDKGAVGVLKVEGTEILDRGAPPEWKLTPPRPITEHLKVGRWYFRDSNWSPDFSASAKQALAFYRAEGGVSADAVDAVVAITPTVLEEVLKLIGPVRVQGIVFTAENVTEKLEYEVEYGYDDRGIPLRERKQIITPLLSAILHRMERIAVFQFQTYAELAKRMGQERHVMAFSPHERWMALARELDITGEVKGAVGDYLLWADANLAALKTDHAIQRTLSYTMRRSEDGDVTAFAKMEYAHLGRFDWRTTRYRTYARVFAPKGSTLLSVHAEGKGSIDMKNVDTGEELEKQWFGTFISIEPGDTRSLEFVYRLPQAVEQSIGSGTYMLTVQKQLGTIAHGLTLNLNFGKTIQSATPAEEEKEWGDRSYRFITDLREDREFHIAL